MPNLKAITKSDFSEKTWQRYTNYLFAAKDSVCFLTAHELPQALVAMPVGFILTDDSYSLVAIQGLEQGSNFYVNSEGQWMGKYVPAAYRSYPFRLAKNEADSEQLVLCIDADSDLVSEHKEDESFFDEDGEISTSVKEILGFLGKVNASLEATARACTRLQEHNLIKPWELKIQLDAGVTNVEGLFCIDESALNSLSDESFIELRKSGALSVAYCQMLSMQHVSDLAQVVRAKSKSTANATAAELNFDAMTENGNINFDNF